ncbi:MAG: hypothetical protein DRP65_03225 [Planctomycetota bacterium]|nr:MAG: hypothetical protein DRP65_03225 [Planctomycetota bacterium]
MPIDITNNIVFDAGFGGLDPFKKLDTDGSGRPEAVDSTLRAEYETFIRDAIETTDNDSQTVAEARRLLETGLLDTEETAQSAAERILMLGI